MRVQTYRCTNPRCGKEQHLRHFDDEVIPQILNCPHCRAGFGVDRQTSIANRVGMVPVGEPAHEEGTDIERLRQLALATLFDV